MRGYIIGAATARLMAPNPPASVFDSLSNWAKTVYLLTSEGVAEGAIIPAQFADNTLETGLNGIRSMVLRGDKKLPWANFSIKNEGGTGGRVEFADAGGALIPGTGAFTLEGWVARNGTNRDGMLFRRHGSAGNLGFGFGVESAGASRLYFEWSADGAALNTLFTSGSGSTITDDNFHYMSVDRTDSGVLRIYLDGVMVAKQTIPTIFANPTAMVWALCNSSGHGSNMYFDDVRATIGVARYGSDAGHQLPGGRVAKGSDGDKYWDNVATYMRFQSDNVSQIYLDNSKYDFSTDNVGNFSNQVTGKFGSGNKNGLGNLNSLAWLNTSRRNAVMNLRGKNFTIEFQFLPGQTDTTGGICGSWESAKFQWRVRIFQGRLIFETSNNGSSATTTIDSGAAFTGTIPADHKLNNSAWNYCVIERSGLSTVKMYLNGVFVASGTVLDTGLFDTGATPQFFPFGVADGAPPLGTIDELRVTVGVARFAEDGAVPLATPPAQYPAYKGSTTVPSDALLDESNLPIRAEDGQFLTQG